MRKSSTLAIAVLLMLAIPLQGFAAAMLSGCALGHHRSDVGSATIQAHHDHAAMHDGHDHAATHAGVVHSGEVPDSTTDTASTCKCSTCSFGTAAPVSKTDTMLFLPTSVPHTRSVSLSPDVVTSGPERPPRTHFD